MTHPMKRFGRAAAIFYNLHVEGHLPDDLYEDLQSTLRSIREELHDEEWNELVEALE